MPSTISNEQRMQASSGHDLLSGWVERWFRMLEFSGSRVLWFFLAVMAVLIGATTISNGFKSTARPDLVSAMIASDLLDAYRGTSATTAGLDGTPLQPRLSRSSAVSSPPGYGLVLFAAAQLDPHVAAGISCVADKRPCGPSANFRSVLMLQLFLAVLALPVLYLLAYRLSDSEETALMTLVLGFVAMHLDEYSRSVRPEIWVLVLTLPFLLLSVEAHRRDSRLFAFFAGVMGGGLGLFSTMSLVMVAAAAAALVFAPAGDRRSILSRGGNVLGFGAGVAVSGLIFVFAVTHSYDGGASLREVMRQWSERAAFQSMDLTTWLASFVLPLPLIAEPAKLVFPAEAVHNLGYFVPGTYTMRGATEIYPKALAEGGSLSGSFIWLMRQTWLEHFPAYLAVTPSIINRGLWGGGDVVGVLGVFHVARMVRLHAATGRLGLLLIVLVPVAALFVANTLITANHHWSNPGLPFLYAYAFSSVVAWFHTARPGSVTARNVQPGSRRIESADMKPSVELMT